MHRRRTEDERVGRRRDREHHHRDGLQRLRQAVAAGLRYRSLAQSIRDTHEWWRAESEERRRNARRWPTAEQEKAVLARLAR